jgi:acetyl-CoA acetyltransferase family protein
MAGIGFLLTTDPDDGPPDLTGRILDWIYRFDGPGSIPDLMNRIRENAAAVRDRLSGDTWQILDRLVPQPEVPTTRRSIAHAHGMMQGLILNLAAFNGLAMENMTRGPLVVSKPSSAYGTDSKMYDSSFGWRFVNPKMHEMYGTDAMGETAENLVDMYQISRDDQDAFALNSQLKAAAAQSSGRLAKEIVSVLIPQRKGDPIEFSKDEFVKPSSTLEGLSKLRGAFRKNGTVTAGNASGLNDGAAATLIASADAVKQYNLKPLARIVSSAVVGVEPRIMGIGPVEASNRALAKAGLTMADIDIIELNEAFAAQALACTRAWGIADNDPRLNPNGGSIAIGHPLGVTGARIAYSAALELQLTGKRYALITMCIGVGQGYAAVIERA